MNKKVTTSNYKADHPSIHFGTFLIGWRLCVMFLVYFAFGWVETSRRQATQPGCRRSGGWMEKKRAPNMFLQGLNSVPYFFSVIYTHIYIYNRQVTVVQKRELAPPGGGRYAPQQVWRIVRGRPPQPLFCTHGGGGSFITTEPARARPRTGGKYFSH